MPVYSSMSNCLDKNEWPVGAHCEIEDFHKPRQRYCPHKVTGERFSTAKDGYESYTYGCSYPMADHEEVCGGFKCEKASDVEDRIFEPRHVDVFYMTYENRVLRTWERNEYHDSDFYATVWCDERDMPVEVCYDTTRSAGGGNAVVDATDEVREKYRVWQIETVRKKKEEADRQYQCYLDNMMDRAGLDQAGFDKLRKATHTDHTLEVAVKLLNTLKNNRFRSDFRKSLAEQIMAWIKDEDNKYPSPLSPKQWGFADNSNFGGYNKKWTPIGPQNMTGQLHGEFDGWNLREEMVTL